MMSLAILLAILLILKPLLALIFFLVLLSLLSVMTTKRKALARDEETYLGERYSLSLVSLSIFLSFSMPLESREEALHLSRGLKVSTSSTKAKLIELAINVVRKTARSRGRRKGRGIGRAIDFKVPRSKALKYP